MGGNGQDSGRQAVTTTLTPREREILLLIWTKGLKNRQCAKILKIAPRTVETHMINMHRKTGAHNVADLLRWAVAQGELTLNGDNKRLKKDLGAC